MSLTSVETLPATGVWSIDSAHSTVTFSVVHHAVATFRSGFTGISGAYDGDLRRLVGQVPATNISLPGLDRLRDHLLTPDFFDADTFPTFSFESTEIRDGEGELAAAGRLTLRGTTHPVEAIGTVHGPMTIRHNDGRISERLGIDLAATIDRRRFGIVRNNEVSDGVLNLGWQVRIEAALELFLEA